MIMIDRVSLRQLATKWQQAKPYSHARDMAYLEWETAIVHEFSNQTGEILGLEWNGEYHLNGHYYLVTDLPPATYEGIVLTPQEDQEIVAGMINMINW